MSGFSEYECLAAAGECRMTFAEHDHLLNHLRMVHPVKVGLI